MLGRALAARRPMMLKPARSTPVTAFATSATFALLAVGPARVRAALPKPPAAVRGTSHATRPANKPLSRTTKKSAKKVPKNAPSSCISSTGATRSRCGSAT